MQQYAGIYLLQNYSTRFGCLSHPSSGVHKTNCSFWFMSYHVSEQQPSTSVAYLGHAGGRLLLRHYDLYQKLQLKFYLLLMMGSIYTRNV